MFKQTTKIQKFSGLRYFSSTPIHTPICVIGGGSAGLNLTSLLLREKGLYKHQIRVFEPSKFHHYQPGWTMLGSGIVKPEQTITLTESIFPNGVTITPYEVTTIQPDQNLIITEDGKKYSYEQLVIATGIQTNFNAIPGLLEACEDPSVPVSSIYHRYYAQKYNKIMREFKGGKAIFTIPPPPVKCAGAPLKILFLSEEHWRKNGVSKSTKIEYDTAVGVVFGVPKYADILAQIAKSKDITINFKNKLVSVDGKKRVVVLEDEKGNKREEGFDILHAVPPMSTPSFLKQTTSLVDQTGFVDVNQYTLRSKKYPNVWGIGDCINAPNAKTVAAITAQAPVLVENIMKVWRDKDNSPLVGYDGYGACPLFVGDKKILLAEFKYNCELAETFPWLQNSPSRLFYWLKVYGFPFAYFRLIKRGLWYGSHGLIKPELSVAQAPKLKEN